jgi:hypothetical protein
LSVRIIYQTSGSTWTWIQYFPNDPETRYLKLGGGTVSGNLAVTGTLTKSGNNVVTVGDTGTVTNTMLAGSIDKTKVSGTAITAADTGTVTSTMIADGTIVNADINASAAIAGTKISPDFGSQNRTSTGTSTAASFIPTSSTAPTNGVYLPAANSVAISTNGTGRLFVDASGRVGVGVSPSDTSGFGGTVDISGTTGAACYVRTSGSATDYGLIGHFGTDLYINNNSNGPIRFFTNTGERMRLDSSGRLGLGTSTPQLSIGAVGGNVLHVAGAGTTGLRIQNTGGNSVDIYAGTDGFINQSGSGTLNFQLAGSTKATLTSTGLGIGSTAPDGNLTIGGLTNTGGQSVDAINVNRTDGVRLFGVKWDVTSNEVRFSGNTKNYVFRNGSSEAETARLTSDGKFLVGTSTSATGTAGSGYARLQVNGNNSGNSGVIVIGAALNTASVASGSGLGYLIFTDKQAGEYAWIGGECDGTAGSGDYPGRLVFSTTADGASSPTERMRITSAGFVKIGETTLTDRDFSVRGAQNLGISYDSTNAQGTGWYSFYSTSSSNTVVQAWIRGDGTYGSRPNVYGATSDIKIKENIEDANSQWTDIKSIQVKNFNLIGDDTRQIGVIAQQVETVSPGLVDETIDRDQDGNDLGTTTKFVKYSVLYMKAVKALQEAMERIEALEAEVAALKAQ